MTHNNPNLDLVKANAYAKSDQIPLTYSQDIERKAKMQNHVLNVIKSTGNNPSPDLVKVNA